MSAASRLAQRAVKVASLAADVIARPPHGVVVLAYHQVGGPRSGGVNLSRARFEEQMAWLAAGGAGRVVTLDEAIDRLGGSRPTAARDAEDLVVITFDDGTADFVEHAVPVIERHGLPVTLYLATDFVERGISFWDDGSVLSWDALRAAVATGLVDIGSHTHTHVLLDREDPAAVAAELDRSIELIHDRLGATARHFAYPKALAPSAASDRLVRERFASAAVAGGRPNRYATTDVWLLARTPVVVADGMRWFERKARGGLRLEGALRQRLDHRRYAEASR